MRLDLATTLHLSWESDAGDRGRDPELVIVALVDRRGRRLIVPLHARLSRHRPCATAPAFRPALRGDAAFTSGTIH